MRRITGVLGLFVAFGLVACEQQLPTDATDGSASAAITGVDAPTLSNQVIDKVSAGGNDICEAFGQPNGCDANWSLTARQKEDGTVSGQFHDNWAGGGNGVRGEIDCLNVDGNGAVVSGIISQGAFDEQDLTGLKFLAAMVDNGTSNGDVPDQITFTIVYEGIADCSFFTPDSFNLFDLSTGQVTIWDN